MSNTSKTQWFRLQGPTVQLAQTLKRLENRRGQLSRQAAYVADAIKAELEARAGAARMAIGW